MTMSLYVHTVLVLLPPPRLEKPSLLLLLLLQLVCASYCHGTRLSSVRAPEHTLISRISQTPSTSSPLDLSPRCGCMLRICAGVSTPPWGPAGVQTRLCCRPRPDLGQPGQQGNVEGSFCCKALLGPLHLCVQPWVAGLAASHQVPPHLCLCTMRNLGSARFGCSVAGRRAAVAPASLMRTVQSCLSGARENPLAVSTQVYLDPPGLLVLAHRRGLRCQPTQPPSETSFLHSAQVHGCTPCAPPSSWQL